MAELPYISEAFATYWLSDPGLRLSSLAARGLWADMMAWMAGSEPVGVLTVNGRAMRLDQLANLTRHPLDEITALVAEMEHNGVFRRRSDDGAIVSFFLRRGRADLFDADWQLKRRQVFERDGFTCQYCGAIGGLLECDHVVPISGGGDSDLDNLKTSCRSCNRSKGAKTVKEWSRG